MNDLSEECTVFCKYVIGDKPTDYVLKKYEEAHNVNSAARDVESQPFNRILLAVARMSPLATRIVDTYAAVFARESLVRKKLVLLLAILESCAPTYSYLDSVDHGVRIRVFSRLVLHVVAWGILFLAAVIIFIPLRAVVSNGAPIIKGSIKLWKES